MTVTEVSCDEAESEFAERKAHRNRADASLWWVLVPVLVAVGLFFMAWGSWVRVGDDPWAPEFEWRRDWRVVVAPALFTLAGALTVGLRRRGRRWRLWWPSALGFSVLLALNWLFGRHLALVPERAPVFMGVRDGLPSLLVVPSSLRHLRADPLSMDPAVRFWLDAADEEAASAATYRGLAATLADLDAPPALVEAAHAAAVDESEHVEICLKIAGSIGTGRPKVATNRTPSATVQSIPELASMLFTGAAVNEQFCSLWLQQASQAAPPEISGLLGQLARDEAGHAALSRRIIRWCLETQPNQTRVALRRAVAALPQSVDTTTAMQRVPDGTRSACGIPDAAHLQEAWRRACRDVCRWLDEASRA